MGKKILRRHFYFNTSVSVDALSLAVVIAEEDHYFAIISRFGISPAPFHHPGEPTLETNILIEGCGSIWGLSFDSDFIIIVYIAREPRLGGKTNFLFSACFIV